MAKKTKGWLIAAATLFLLGGLLMTGAFLGLQWNFEKLSTTQYETNSHPISKSFKNISILTDTADIEFVPTEQSSTIVCYEERNAEHTVTVTGDTLTIKLVDNRKWYDRFGFHFGNPKITVHIPQGEYGSLQLSSDTGDISLPENFRFQSIDISLSTGDITCRSSCLEDARIRTTTGDIYLENLSVKDLELSVSTGHAKLTDVACKSFTSHGSTGDLKLQNVIAQENMTLQRSTGYITFDRCDAREIFVETNTGDVKGTLLTDKIFFAQTDTGNVNVPKTANGGRCEITTSTGDISIQITP